MKKFQEIAEQHREKGRFKPTVPRMVPNTPVASPRPTSDSADVKLKEASAAAIAAATAISKKKSGNYDKEGMRVKAYKNPDHPNRKSNEQRRKEMNEYVQQQDPAELKGTSSGAMSLLDKPNKEPMKTYKQFQKEEVETPPMRVRSMYTRQYAKHGGTISTAKTASAKAYDAVEKMHGKEMRNKLEAFHRKNMNEDVEQIDELKKSTLYSYITKAADNARVKKDAAASSFQYKYITHGMKKSAEGDRRLEGIKSAAKRLAKEETNINEVSDATLASYKEKAKKSADELESQKKFGKALTRRTGILRAVGKQVGRAGEKLSQLAKEETEMNEAKDVREYDYEGDMAKTQLKTIIRNAQKIHDMIEDNENMPEWVQGKITLAKDYIVVAANYLESEMSEQTDQGAPKKKETKFHTSLDKLVHKTFGKSPAEMKKEEVEQLDEKNAPTNPGLWSRAKALARSKFDVYPSAYANGWAAKWYKSKGGGWKSVSEEVEKPPFEGGTKSKSKVIAGKYGKGYSTARHLARQAMQKQVEKMKKKPIKEESKKVKLVKDVMKKKNSEDAFQKDPELSNTLSKNV